MIDFSGVNLNTVGEQNFTVTYNGTEYTFTVTVLPGGEECLFTNVVMGLKQSDALIDALYNRYHALRRKTRVYL